MKQEQLLSLSNKAIADLFNHKEFKQELKWCCGFLHKRTFWAANLPYLFVGFIREDNRHFGVGNIVEIEILNK